MPTAPTASSLKSLVLSSLALVPVVVPALLIAGCDRQSAPESQPQASQPASEAGAAIEAVEAIDKLDRSHKGEPMPSVVLVDPAGQSLDLASLKGKPLLVNLWATWCAPCIAEMPTLARLAAREGETGVKVLPVSQDMGQDDKVVEILKRRKLDAVAPWIDEKGDLGFRYGGNLPVTVLFDAQGKEVWRWTGGNDWTSADALKLVGEGK